METVHVKIVTDVEFLGEMCKTTIAKTNNGNEVLENNVNLFK